MKTRFAFTTLLVASFLAAAGAATSLHAQATRTWVSGVGDDANPCSRTAPCKTFAGAISKTAAAGEITVLDPGGFGAVTITKSITINGGGIEGGINAAGTNGIIVNAGAGDVVIVRNLVINGVGSGLNGIRFIAGKALHVEGCTITSFNGSSGFGIDFEPAGVSPDPSTLSVSNTQVRNCGGGGILIRPGAGFNTVANLEKVVVAQNQFGLRAESRAKVTLHDCTTSNNVTNGVLAFSSGSAVEVNLDNCVSANNTTNGVKSEGPGAVVRLSNTTITDNSTGLASASGGAIVTFGNNRIAGNAPGGDGAPTIITGQQ